MMCTEIHDVVCTQTKTSARHANDFLTGEVTGKNVIHVGTIKKKKSKKINHLHCMGPDIFSMLHMKGDVWNALLTKKVT